jgi:hypothetical protein
MEREDIIDQATTEAVRETLDRLSPVRECLVSEDLMLFRMLIVLELYPVIHAAVETAVIMELRKALTPSTN